MSRSSPAPKKPASPTRRKAPRQRPSQRLASAPSTGAAGTPATTSARPPGPCVAAIGASAGGFEEIRTFFDTMPADSGIAFVVIQHLHPTQKSLAAELFGKRTKMPVVQAEDGMRVEANHVYTVPPNTYPSIAKGRLRLAPPKQQHGPRLPIDHFFTSLGEDQHERAIGIILSGSGSDGALGLKSIVANGGVVLAQDPETAQFDGMPQSAIASGMVNYILPVTKIPEVLVGYARHPYVATAAPPEPVAQSEEAALESVLGLIRGRRGYNFSGYKHGTLLRRIQRRMGLRSIERWNDYIAVLRKNSGEIDALFKDLLIGVTEFFRDPDAWNILQTEVIAPLVKAKPRGEPIRVWVPGCATGEEAYALAMLLLDELKQADKRCPVQVFATDTNDATLQVGRDGVYPSGVATRISPEKLRHFFIGGTDNHHNDQVARELREAVVFGVQNLVTDPPFSRLDLISCRNLLIYFESDLQMRIIDLFQFALRPGGYLFLGSAETIGERGGLFKPISKKWRIYQRSAAPDDQSLNIARGVDAPHAATAAAAARRAAPRSLQLANRAQQLILDRFAPAAVLVNNRNHIVYFCGPVENYLLRPRGAPTQDLLAQARDTLRPALRGALREAAARGATVIRNARVKRNGGYAPVRLTLAPAGTDADGAQLLLLVFQDEAKVAAGAEPGGGDSELVRQLEQELGATKDDLQSNIERMETSNEELKVSNEEVVSVNEELQSINEELESSKEELQSLNEELSTVNQQLQSKVAELETANSDLKNLLASSEIATICVDRNLHIRWFTPAMKKVYNVLDSDVGRPISDFAAALSGGALLDHAAAVLEKLTPLQRELRLEDGRWYLRRIVPYRGEDKRIDGVVITFTDITEARLAAEAAVATQRKANESLEQKVRERTVQLRALSVELSLAEERERRSLAQDLHDDLGQLLAIVKHKLTALHGCGHSADVAGELKNIEDLVDQANKSMRTLAFQLSPPVLHTLGLIPALEWLTEEMERVYGLKVRLSDDGVPKRLDEPSRSTLFRAVRELLINVAKHAGTRRAEITSLLSDNRLTLAVNDDGGGFDYQKALQAAPGAGGLGLASLRERIEFIGGEMHVDSSPREGTTVTLIAPFQDAAAEAAQ